MNRTDRSRLERLERRTGSRRAEPPVIIRQVAETGEPIRAVGNGETLIPNEGESAEAFEARAVEHFAHGWDTVVVLPAKGSYSALD